MTITRRRALQLTAGAAAGSTLLSFVRTARAATINWDMSDEYGENTLTGQTSRFFIDELSKRVGDELQITYHGGGALGYKSVDHFDAVEDGAVQVAMTLATQQGGVDPLFDMTSLPFLVRTPEAGMRLWQIARPEYEKIFDDHNMVLLYAMPNPPSGIFAKKPIDSASALDGLRIRTYDVSGTKTLSAAGASPLQIAWADLVPQLSTGAIDAVLTSADGGVQLSVWDYLTDFTELNYVMPLFMAHVNKDAYNELSDEAKAAVAEVSALTDEFAWGLMTSNVAESYEKLRSNGINVTTDPPDEVFERLQTAGEDVKREWLDKVGERGQKILNDFAS